MTRHGAAQEIMMTQTLTSSSYIVQTASTTPSVRCWGTYRRVAVIEVDDGRDSVAMISERARGCRAIVRTWENQHVGTTSRCAYQVALAEAEELADRLNADRQEIASELQEQIELLAA